MLKCVYNRVAEAEKRHAGGVVKAKKGVSQGGV